MANHPSAEKRHRQNLKRRARNREARAGIRTAVKSALISAKDGNAEKSKESVKLASRLLDKAAIHGVVHKNNARRRISRLQQQVNQLLAS